jgi:hypothetical protein
VRARSTDRGTLQKIIIEKVPATADIPNACRAFDLCLEEKAWLLRRGVEMAQLSRHSMAKYLSHHRPACKELLKAYATLWEAEWRLTSLTSASDEGDSTPRARSQSAEQDATGTSPRSASNRDSSAGPPGAARNRSISPNRSTIAKWFGDVVDQMQGTTPHDKSNGDILVSAIRSFFAGALRVAQLEADPVQRVVEAFAAALAADPTFMQVFEPSMLPEKERRAYKTPQDMLFGLTYTTMMLNTDCHNSAVANKTWDAKKFVGAGKDCGVNGGLMAQIYKNIQKEEL